MRYGLVGEPGCQVGYAGDCEHAHAHVPRHDDLRDCRHAHQVHADLFQILNFGVGLERWPEQSGIDAASQPYPEPCRFLLRETAELRIVSVAHIEEAQPEAFIVGAGDGIRALQVDVVANQHQAALMQLA